MKSSLFVRWVVINSLVIAVYITGLVYDITTDFVTDSFYMTQGIALIALLFMIRAGYISWMIQKDMKIKTKYTLNYHSAIQLGRGSDYKDLLVDIFSRRIAMTKLGGTILMSLGLVGTVLGISISFSGINADIIGNAQASSDAIAILINGMAVAFRTTLLGLLGMLINMINQHMIVQETNRLYTSIVIEE